MSLDSSLRITLLRSAEPIDVDVDGGLSAVAGRIRSTKRRRIASVTFIATAAVLTTMLWVGSEGIDRSPDVPPAQEDRERRPQPRVKQEPQPVRQRSDAPDPAGRLSVDKGSAPQGMRERRPLIHAGPLTDPPAPFGSHPWTRVENEPYQVNYVAGTHLAESAGTGCSQGAGAMDGNDCIPFQVGPTESRFKIRLVDDTGVLVGAQLYEHHRGMSIDHGIFCGRSSALQVHPGALLLVYITTSDECSQNRPTTGSVIANFSSE